MTIANGNTIAKADLNAWLTTQLGLIQADNAQLPAGVLVNLFFPNLDSGVAARARKSVFVVPFDCLVEVIAPQAGDLTAGTLSVSITGDGALQNWPIAASGTVGSGTTKLTRLLFDNTKTKAGRNFSTTARAFRVLPKGATITLTVSTTGAAATAMVVVQLVLRQFFARE